MNINEKEELVINVVCSDVTNAEFLYFYYPKVFKIQSKKKEAVDFNLGDTVKFNFNNNNYFKFYKKNNEYTSILFNFNFENSIIDYILCKGLDNKTYLYEIPYDESLEIILVEEGIYYLEFYCNERNYESFYDLKFTTFLVGEMISNIDLSQRIYSSNIQLKIRGNKPNSSYYKVQNIKENINVFFIYYNPFEICNDNIGNCTQITSSFLFLKNYNYTMHVHFIDNYLGYDTEYDYFPYSFFPIFEDTIQEIKKVQNYVSSIPKIYHFKFDEIVYICFEELQKGYLSELTEEFNLDNLDKLFLFERNNIVKYDSSNKTGIIIVLPTIVYPTTKVIIAHKLVESPEEETIEVPSNKNMLISYF